MLGKQFWGQGYATESALGIINYLFKLPTIERVFADVVTENIASWRILEKVGMQREGCLRRKFFNDNGFYDLYVYSVLRDEWSSKDLKT